MQFTVATLLVVAATTVTHGWASAITPPRDSLQTRDGPGADLPRIDDYARIDFCTDSYHGGACENNWGLRALGADHCWNLDKSLQYLNDHISSVYPLNKGAVWRLFEDFDCQTRNGQTYWDVDHAIDDLQSIGANDKISSVYVWYR